MQISRSDCPWYGANECGIWRKIMMFMLACVVLDLIASIAGTFAGKAMETSPHIRPRQCAAHSRDVP